jgi:hypothetical protein
MTDDELLGEVRKLRHELRQLRHGDLVARLTEAERQAIADLILDRLDERFAADRKAAAEQTPLRRARAKEKRYF